jgi:hypothetical protein
MGEVAVAAGLDLCARVAAVRRPHELVVGQLAHRVDDVHAVVFGPGLDEVRWHRDGDHLGLGEQRAGAVGLHEEAGLGEEQEAGAGTGDARVELQGHGCAP